MHLVSSPHHGSNGSSVVTQRFRSSASEAYDNGSSMHNQSIDQPPAQASFFLQNTYLKPSLLCKRRGGRLTYIVTVTMADSLRGLRWLLGTAAIRSRNPQSAKRSFHIDRTLMVRSKTTKGARAFSRSTRVGASSKHAINSCSFAHQNELPRHIRRMATVQHSKGVTYSRVVLRLKQT